MADIIPFKTLQQRKAENMAKAPKITATRKPITANPSEGRPTAPTHEPNQPELPLRPPAKKREAPRPNNRGCIFLGAILAEDGNGERFIYAGQGGGDYLRHTLPKIRLKEQRILATKVVRLELEQGERYNPFNEPDLEF